LKTLSRLFIFFAACAGQTALAETIQLKDGTVIKGSIVSMDEQNVILDTSDLGRMTIKRRTIQSIRDGVELPAGTKVESPSNMNININNQQSNDQKNDQKNDQRADTKVEQKNDSRDDSRNRTPKHRMWESGIFGRLGVGRHKNRVTGAPASASQLNLEKWETGIYFDLFGYRSSSWWSAVIFMNGGALDNQRDVSGRATVTGSDKPRTDITNFGVRLDANAFQTSHGKSVISQLYFGPSVAVQQLKVKRQVEDEPNSFSFQASGTRFGVDLGYEILVGPHFGFMLGTSFGSAELNKFELGDTAAQDGFVLSDFSKSKLKTNSRLLTLGISWNADI
jgi:small nuclear ribonucleoprotein (snRNP)-like protein